MKFTKENVKTVIADWFWKEDDSHLDELREKIHELDDAPEKVVVPKFVAEFYEECANATLGFLIAQLEATYSRSELRKWYSSCSGRHRNGKANAQEVIAKMKLYGYEVEKEPLYEVVIHETDDDRLLLVTNHSGYKFELESDNEGLWKQRHTESEVKAIDERCWAFAVKVDETE